MELQTFAPDLEKLGYGYVSFSEEESNFLKMYGGVFYKWSHKHDPNLTSMTICSCGIKAPYVVSQCIFCGNKNFRQQISPTRKMKQENIDTTIVEKVSVNESEVRLFDLSYKYKLNISLYETMFNFITNELYKKGQSNIFYIGLIKSNKHGYKELIIFNEHNEHIPIVEFLKIMKFKDMSIGGNFIVKQLENIHGSDINFYNLAFLSNPLNYSHDRIQQELNTTFFKDTWNSNHTFIEYFDYSSEGYNKKNFDFSKKDYNFFKVKKEPLNYLVSLNKNGRSYGMGLLINENIIKIQKMNNFINKELFIKYPQLENVTFDTMYNLYKIISSNKTKEKHTMDDIMSYCDYLSQNEALIFEQGIAFYAEYLRKVKKANVEMYVKELKLKTSLV